ncbi:hypothetical protein TNCV_2633411 [Trichonephila clavipes]|nr:hypothetical protein TNCV_2633411 [Trichonephila clavipes]
MGVSGWRFDIIDFFEEMEGKSCVWADDVVIAVGIFALCLDDSGANIVSISKPPDRSFLIDIVSPPIPIIALWTTKEIFVRIHSLRTSLAGLALDSATSSGLGRALHSAMQDPIQAPPGTTRQARLYTR